MFTVPDESKYDEFPVLHSSHVNYWRPLLGSMGRHRTGAKTNLIQAIIATMHDAKCITCFASGCGQVMSLSRWHAMVSYSCWLGGHIAGLW